MDRSGEKFERAVDAAVCAYKSYVGGIHGPDWNGMEEAINAALDEFLSHSDKPPEKG